MTSTAHGSKNPIYDDLYPERKGSKIEYSKLEYMLGHAKPTPQKIACYNNVIKVYENFPLIKLMISALETYGCKVGKNARDLVVFLVVQGLRFNPCYGRR